MEADALKLLVDIHGSTKANETKLDTLIVGQRDLEARARMSETLAAEHSVKIERLQADLSGAFKKVRSVEDKQTAAETRARIASKAEERGGSRWLKVVEVIAEAPKWAHAVLTVGSVLITAAVILVKHWPR